MKKFLLWTLGIVVVVIAGAAVAVPLFVDPNDFKPEITAAAKKATGRNLAIGDISLSVLPTPRLTLEDVRFANVEGAATPEMAKIARVRVLINPLALLDGTIDVTTVEIVEPVIALEKLADGKASWNLAPPAKPAGAPATASPAPAAKAPDGIAGYRIAIGSLRITDGTILYRDAAAGTTERITGLDVEGRVGELSTAFLPTREIDLRVAARLRDVPLSFTASVGKYSETAPVPVSAKLGIGGSGASLQATGTIAGLAAEPKVALDVVAEGGNLGGLIAALSGGPAPPALAQPFRIETRAEAGGTTVTLNNLMLQFGTARLTGAVSTRLGDVVRADVTLKGNSLDVDRLLAAAQKPAAPAAGSAATADPATKPATANGAATGAAGRIEFPADIEATLDLAVDSVLIKAGQVREVALAASLKGGKLTVTSAGARLPGGTLVRLSAAADSPAGALRYSGNLEVRAANLRTFFDWLAVDVSSVTADRLRTLSASARIDGNLSQVQIANISVQLDASRMTGGVTYAFDRPRPAFGASVNIDQFNADAYLPKAAVKPADAKPAAKPASPATPAAAPATAPGPLAALNAFDANLAFRIGSLTYQQATIQDVRFDGTLVNGELTLRDASVRSLAGTSAQIKGTLTGLTGIPAFKGTVAAASDDLTGLFRVAGISSPVPPRKLGRMRLSSRTDASKDRISIDATLQIAEVRAKLTGSASGLPEKPRFDLALDAEHPEFARFAALFGSGAPGPQTGPFSLKATTKGGLDAVTFSTEAGIAGGAFKLGGRIDNPAAAAKYDLALDLSHPDVARLIAAIDPQSRPSNPRLGGLKLAARIAGDPANLAISGLEGMIGPTRISGQGSYRIVQPRSVLDLKLAAGEIPVSDFLPVPPRGAATPPPAPAPGGGTTAPRPAGERWSRDPIDTAALGLVDANFDIGAKALLYRNFRVDDPKILAVLKDKVLEIRQIAGRMFDGGFEMKGRLDGTGVPAASTTVTIDRANVGKALFQAAEFDIANGTLTYDMNLTARGRSQFDMVKSLDGGGKLAVRDGVVKGFNLKSVSDGLKNLNRLSGLLGLLNSGMGGGTTKFSALDGTFTVKNGVMRTSDLRMVAEGGTGSVAGFADLPAWNMDMAGDFRLSDHPNAPPFRMRAVGPIDNPRRLFDFNQLQQWVVQQGVGGLIERFVPGARRKDQPPAPSTQEQQQPQQPKEINPKDVLKDLLRGLKR